jgi:hypothetical protein
MDVMHRRRSDVVVDDDELGTMCKWKGNFSLWIYENFLQTHSWFNGNNDVRRRKLCLIKWSEMDEDS